MDYKEALKKVQNKKPRENYLLIKMGYDNNLVLPHKDGIAFLHSISCAEQLYDPYNAKHRIAEVEKGKITVTQMSSEEYDRYKIAALLDLTIEEVKAAELSLE